MPVAKILLAVLLVLAPVPAVAQGAAVATSGAILAPDQLETVLQTDSVVTGFVKTPDGRIFLNLSRIDGSVGPEIVEWVDGKAKPYPDADWNDWRRGADPARHFVNVNALRTDPHGTLWVVDIGAPGLSEPKLQNGPKIVGIDLATNRVGRVLSLESLTNAKSRIDDIRFNGRFAYVTDSGSPGVIILDLASGAGRRVLDGDPSLTAQRPITAEDHVLRGLDGAPAKIHADQLEVSPDGKFFYYQPASGPMSRIATRYIDDPKLTSPQLSKHITTFSKTGSTGGTAIDVDGNIYCSDTDKRRILTIDPEGHRKVLIEDPRLLWVDDMWIDDAGYLYLPAAQLDRIAPFNGGVSKLEMPISVYRLKIGVKPSPNDHP